MRFFLVKRQIAGEKFIGREFNAAEQFTGILRAGNTFLMRNTEVIGRNQHLYVALQLYNAEQTDGDQYLFIRFRTDKFAAIPPQNGFRNTEGRHTGMTASFGQLGTQRYRFGYLYYCLRTIACGLVLLIGTVSAAVG